MEILRSFFSFSFFSYILQGNAISIFNPGNFLKNCNCLECIKSLKFLFFLTSKEMELEWRFLLFLVNSLFRVRILCRSSMVSKDFLTKDTKIQITSGCNNGYRLWKKRIYSTRIVRIGSDLSIRDKKNCSRFSWRERTSWNKWKSVQCTSRGFLCAPIEDSKDRLCHTRTLRLLDGGGKKGTNLAASVDRA